MLVQGNNRLTISSPGRAALLPVVDQEPLERREQEGAEPAADWVGVAQIFLSQQAGKELLGQILRLLDAAALPAHIAVKGIPVGLTQTLQRGLGVGLRAPAGAQHVAPVRRGKAAAPGS